ncbi:MAG TPA: ATP-binding protein, partial [Myxococcales bacterium]|nr:ATP-binding protein [Myxococcales bacterium]
VQLVQPDQTHKTVFAWHPDPKQRELTKRFETLVPPQRWDARPETNSLVQRRTMVFEQITEQLLRTGAANEEVAKLYLEVGMTSVIVAPMFDGAKPLGVLVLVTIKDGGRRYTAGDADFAFSLAGRAALAVRNARLVGEIAHERDQQRELRQESESRAAELTAVLDAGPNGIVLFDVEGRLRVASRKMNELFGGDWDQMQGQPYDVIGRHLAACFDAPREPALDKVRSIFADRALRGEEEIEVVFPKKRTLLRATAPVLGADGTYVGRIFSYIDMSDARALDRQRHDFLTVAAHELRTPLTPLSMYLQSMERRAAQKLPIEEEMLSKARRQVARLSKLVEDLLDVSRMESRRAQPFLARVSLDELAAQVVADFRPQARLHELIFHRSGSEAMVMADRPRLEQVLVNLLQNAIKYSPAGGVIEVRVSVSGKEVLLSVKDPGIGVPPEEQARLFQRFFRAGNASSRNFGGLGIGLYVSQEIIQRHGGSFEVQSEVGKGSTFTFRLPLAGRDARSRGRVLLVDDDPEILEATGQLLREWGYAVDEARDGATALELARDSRPDLMLIDLMMPVMDGWTLIGRIRSEKVAEGVPLVIFSADRDAREKGRKLEADAALRKPFELEELQELLERLLAPKPAA